MTSKHSNGAKTLGSAFALSQGVFDIGALSWSELARRTWREAIDDDVLEWFRKQVHAAGGGNYQTVMNRALREHMEHQVEPLEDTIRRVLREVIPVKKPAKRRSA